MEPGQRVAAGHWKGTLVVPDASWFTNSPELEKRKSNYLFVQFDEAGPYGNGRGVYLHSTWAIRRINEPKKVVNSDGNTGET
jgi:hypothetical protein